MRVSEEIFACWSKACAPPPAGRGGSSKGSPWSNRQKLARHGKGKYSDPKSKSQSKKDIDDLFDDDKLRKKIRKAGEAARSKYDKQTGFKKRMETRREPMAGPSRYDQIKKKG